MRLTKSNIFIFIISILLLNVTYDAFGAKKIVCCKKEKIFSKVDEAPSFPGDVEEMHAFIHKTKRFPQDAANEGIEGNVLLKFVVKKDGTIDQIKVINAVLPSIDAEAIRVLKAMPKWIPAKRNGKPVNSYYTLSISFHLLK